MNSILKKPLLTEKISALTEKGQYGFVVDKKANKVEIKEAVEKTYGVNVRDVKTMICNGKGKTRFVGGNFLSGKTSSYKKAIVTVAEGEIIDFYNGI